ncbi:hypothetical protein AB833_18810 [Chromatiales bacterium (ex Bugula neritina AB1)]|nr:hypothetical protein AB833_18810 [Chromatiales bacterium (ex Bugula neritina AB1)]
MTLRAMNITRKSRFMGARKTAAVLAVIQLLVIGGCATKEYVNESITLAEDHLLDADVLKTKYTINAAGVVLDGNGYTIDGRCNTDCIGLTINANNVTVRNVTITGFDGGVSINPHVSGVRFENVKILNNVNHGVFVNVGVNGFTCNNCDVSDNGTMGIYLEYNSYGAVIENSRIANNGYRDKDTGSWKQNLKNDKKDKREGLAIDSSQNNIVRNTVFSGNALTGITLYRNCGERGIRREWGANYNHISNSTFNDGIHIAARQDKDLSSWSCVEPYILDSRYVMDEAEYNILDNITLEGNATIVVQDDNNSITSVNGGKIIFSSVVRDAINQPLATLTTDNIDNTVLTKAVN